MLITVFTLALLSSCASNPEQINLMPAPAIYGGGVVSPFVDPHIFEKGPQAGVFYATDRAPAEPESNERFYQNSRGHVLRLGVAEVELGDAGTSWEEARRISLQPDRTEQYPLHVTQVEALGILEDTVTIFHQSEIPEPARHQTAKAFTVKIDEKLATSKIKDIYVYVPGFLILFENPMLVATELWHFLGYEGVFIAYSWPTRPNDLAYVSDLESAAYSARNLRLLLTYLARETTAERIHVIGFSAGTRVVIDALAQLAMLNAHKDIDNLRKELRLDQVFLIGSDFDVDIVSGHIADGLLRPQKRLTLYLSETDEALGMSSWVFDRPRLGQLVQDDELAPAITAFLNRHEELAVIDVTAAEKAATGNGHHYFRQSPWVSSDLLMTLMYGLLPRERGLENTEASPIWHFPPDYMDRLRRAVMKMGHVTPEG
jgi:esterase/lipase superfamily enzyme